MFSLMILEFFEFFKIKKKLFRYDSKNYSNRE